MSGERVEWAVFILQERAHGVWRDEYFYTREHDAADGYNAACQSGRFVRVLKRTTVEEVTHG